MKTIVNKTIGIIIILNILFYGTCVILNIWNTEFIQLWNCTYTAITILIMMLILAFTVNINDKD